ncbi:MAG: amino acid ABC transporter permease [Opitutaceae bacterium]|jgi:polar amino acid transport system permease protein|nr:amino acid ABC transporter permease [Opitutaceae bacterium]
MRHALDTLWQNAPLLLDGLWATLGVAAAATFFSILGGVALGMARVSCKNALMQAAARAWLEVFRVIPVLVWLFVFFFAVPSALNLDLSGTFVAILVFSLWGASEMSDIVRGALTAIPRAQYDAGRALGMSAVQLQWRVILPQAARRMLPGAVNLVTRIIKTTSLVVIVGVVDVIKRGQQIIERTQEPFIIYAFILLLFFALCHPLSLLSRRLEKRFNKT